MTNQSDKYGKLDDSDLDPSNPFTPMTKLERKNKRAADAGTYHVFIRTLEPDRCRDCGNARGTVYHGQPLSYMARMFDNQAKSLRAKV